MSASYMKKAKDFYAGDEAYIDGKWKRVGVVLVKRTIVGEEAALFFVYEPVDVFKARWHKGDFKLRYRSGR